MKFDKTEIYASHIHPIINVSSDVTFIDSVLDFGKNSIIIEDADHVEFRNCEMDLDKEQLLTIHGNEIKLIGLLISNLFFQLDICLAGVILLIEIIS